MVFMFVETKREIGREDTKEKLTLGINIDDGT